MEFTQRNDYSIDRYGWFYQISQDEFVHRCINPSLITWIKGRDRIEKRIDSTNRIGIVDNAYFFRKDRIIKKAELINGEIVITDGDELEKGTTVYFKFDCPHYFMERVDYPNVLFAFQVNEDPHHGMKFNISIDNLAKVNQLHVQDNCLYGIFVDGRCSSINRYHSDSGQYLERKELPKIWGRSIIFHNTIFYLTYEADLIAVKMNDL